jgi:hypothetical protein
VPSVRRFGRVTGKGRRTGAWRRGSVVGVVEQFNGLDEVGGDLAGGIGSLSGVPASSA